MFSDAQSSKTGKRDGTHRACFCFGVVAHLYSRAPSSCILSKQIALLYFSANPTFPYNHKYCPCHLALSQESIEFPSTRIILSDCLADSFQLISFDELLNPSNVYFSALSKPCDHLHDPIPDFLRTLHVTPYSTAEWGVRDSVFVDRAWNIRFDTNSSRFGRCDSELDPQERYQERIPESGLHEDSP